MSVVRVVCHELRQVGGSLPAGGLPTARFGHDVRRGVQLILTDETGARGGGEASPLPGYSRDRLDDCARALAALDPGALAIQEAEFGLAALREISGPLASLPAARFALETAMVELVSRRRGEPAWCTLRSLIGAAPSTGGPPEVVLATLLPYGAPNEVLSAAATAIKRGVRTVKLKIGRPGEWRHELSLLTALRKEFGAAVALRLDANQSFGPALARERLSELCALDPELVEEPVAGLTGTAHERRAALGALESSRVPIALDESLATPLAPELLSALAGPGTPLVALVLKPTALGGFCRSIELAIEARERGLHAIVTHTFDGPIALTAASALALALDGARAAGLDRHSALTAYPWAPLPAHRGSVIRGWSEPGFGGGLEEAPA